MGTTAKFPILTPAIGVQAQKLSPHSHAIVAMKTIDGVPLCS